MRLLTTTVCIFISGLAFAMPAGGLDKKHIGLLFDVMKTTPSNILANADKFAGHAPYLDGVAISLNDVFVPGEGGSVVTTGLSKIMSGTVRWTRDSVKEHIPVLRQIAQKPHLKESFLLFWMSPKYCDTRLDWDDDKAWANYAENMAVAAWLAKEGDMKGLMLDPEEYANAKQYNHTPADPPYAECAKLARKRGREVFSRVFREYPDAILFTLWYFGRFRHYPEGVSRTNPVSYAEDRGELLHHFYNGILDVMPAGARIIDGCEHYSLSATKYQYLFNANSISTAVLPFVAPENRNKYRAQVRVSNTHFLDMFVQNANPKSHWYHGPVNGSRLEHLRLNFEQSLLTADEYVWIYGENSGKLFNWDDGHFEDRKTWEENIPGMTETFMLLKDPERLASMRREKLAAEGKLVNLVPDAKAVRMENPARRISYGQPDRKKPTVKGVCPGERYIVKVQVNVSVGRRGKEGPVSAARPGIVWTKNGKRIDADPTPIKVPADAGKEWVYAEEVVVVPEGADGMMLDLAAELNADENIGYRYPSIWNAFESAKLEMSPSKSKWVFDPKKRTVTDGNWTLSARVHKDRLLINGKGADTVGSGVLDLRNIKADTGYELSTIGKLGGCTSITALVVDRAEAIGGRTLSGCPNICTLIADNCSSAHGESASIENRRTLLSRVGLRKELVEDSKMRLSYRHKPVQSKSCGGKISAKGIKPGELYNLRLSMRRKGAGSVRLGAAFRDEKGRFIRGGGRTINMKEAREDGVWREGETVVRAPEGASEVCFNIHADLHEGGDIFEFDKFEIFKIGDPIPAWPAEFELEKGSAKK